MVHKVHAVLAQASAAERRAATASGHPPVAAGRRHAFTSPIVREQPRPVGPPAAPAEW